MIALEGKYQQDYQRLRNMGIPEAEIQRELQRQMDMDRAQIEAAERAAAPPVPQGPPEWEQRFDDGEARFKAQYERDHNPHIIAVKAANQERIKAQAQVLLDQRDAINKELAKLDAEYRRNL